MNWYYDAIILMGILVSGFVGIRILYHRRRTKRSLEYRYKRVSLTIGLLCLLATATFVYGSIIEPTMLITNEVTIDLDGIDRPLRVAFVADVQVGLYKHEAWLDRMVDRVLSLNPDIILLGGDYVENDGSNPEQYTELAPLRRLTESHPVFAIPGNHEYGTGDPENIRFFSGDMSEDVQQLLTSFGIRYLVNETIPLTIQDQPLLLFGGDWGNRIDTRSVQPFTTTTLPIIALLHSPAALYDVIDTPIDLILSGHTHGGQIRLPFIGPIGRVEPIIPAAWYQGLHYTYNKQLFVTSGAGVSAVRARLFNPPEVVIITLH